DGKRLLGDLRKLAEFGSYKTGVHRPTYSTEDMAARHWLAERMKAAGLDVVIDGVGNVLGRGRSKRKRLLMGSHAETQPHAGWLDGAMGIVYGIEVARAFAEDPACAGLGVDVAAWADEESHYLSFLGSRSFCGEVSDAELDQAKNRDDGTPLRTALERAGLAGRPIERMDPAQYAGYLEGHVEQGDYLDAGKLRIGIVTGIVGIRQFRLSFAGQQNHAGTTRMAIRKDAGVALIRLCNAIDQRFPAVAGERSVWTTGRILLDPGAPSIVPGAAEMMFQFRDADPERLDLLEKTLEELVAESNRRGPCACRLEMISRTPPKLMDAGFQDALEAAAKRHAPNLFMRMPSAAGHDAQVLGRKLPAGMLFVPSIGGISHHYAENTADDDIVLGCQIFADGAYRILSAAA
ncbi:MAG: Zn-dependent hydrolase, partial [Roseiarcus sp.]